MSKWVKGACEKPLFVCHSNGNGYFKACALDKAQAKQAREDIILRREDVRKLLRMGRPYVLFSGGADSLCLLEYMRSIASADGKRITAIHADTTAGFPEVEKYVRRVCKKLEIDLEVVHPQHDFFDIAKRWGIPGPRSRWCCKTLKVAPIRRFLDTVQGPKVVFDGIRAAESRMRATYTPVWYHPAFKCLCASPLFCWSDEKVIDYTQSHGLPVSPAARLGTSAECWCGAYQGKSDFEMLLDLHPEIFDKLLEVEKAQKGKYTFIYENGKRIPLGKVRAEVVKRATSPSSHRLSSPQ